MAKITFKHYEVLVKEKSGNWDSTGTTSDPADKPRGGKLKPRYNRTKR